MATLSEWTFGTHRARFEDPDVLQVTFEGPVTVEDAKKALPIYREVAGSRPVFMVADISRSALDAEARKYLGEHIQAEWFRGVVYVGANVVLRAVSKALSVLILFNSKSQFDIRFVATHAEAREQLEKWRDQKRSAA